eukprot:CAMPEP_0119165672 /NCGR_PEP_ID=MMETSP1315-20130426/5289_1 /TAXON_ID=676789 /ORGANISM="Prasinoderma singularis, Strain RCC927" /LENGTH=47 /DNA_ID= /DNA_START= /DNA_END= /DNA_ORIENTATION=
MAGRTRRTGSGAAPPADEPPEAAPEAVGEVRPNLRRSNTRGKQVDHR